MIGVKQRYEVGSFGERNDSLKFLSAFILVKPTKITKIVLVKRHTYEAQTLPLAHVQRYVQM